MPWFRRAIQCHVISYYFPNTGLPSTAYPASSLFYKAAGVMLISTLGCFAPTSTSLLGSGMIFLCLCPCGRDHLIHSRSSPAPNAQPILLNEDHNPTFNGLLKSGQNNALSNWLLSSPPFSLPWHQDLLTIGSWDVCLSRGVLLETQALSPNLTSIAGFLLPAYKSSPSPQNNVSAPLFECVPVCLILESEVLNPQSPFGYFLTMWTQASCLLFCLHL